MDKSYLGIEIGGTKLQIVLADLPLVLNPPLRLDALLIRVFHLAHRCV